jgi:hypothetical protein
MQDDASGVDHAPQGWHFQLGEIFFDADLDGAWVGMLASANLLANSLQDAPYFVHDQPTREASLQASEVRENMIYGRQIAQLFFGRQVTMLS